MGQNSYQPTDRLDPESVYWRVAASIPAIMWCIVLGDSRIFQQPDLTLVKVLLIWSLIFISAAVTTDGAIALVLFLILSWAKYWHGLRDSEEVREYWRNGKL